jgi:AraC-like DNA-binding protein
MRAARSSYPALTAILIQIAIVRRTGMGRLFRLFQIFLSDRAQLPGDLFVATAFSQSKRAICLLSEMFRFHRQEQCAKAGTVAAFAPSFIQDVRLFHSEIPKIDAISPPRQKSPSERHELPSQAGSDRRSAPRGRCKPHRSLWKPTEMSADVLSDVLRAVKLTGAVFVTIDVSPPWSAPVPSTAALKPIVMPKAQHLISYHLVTEGGAWAIPHHGEPIELAAGDVIVFPRGDAHVMCSDPKVSRGPGFDVSRIKPSEQWPYRIVGSKKGSDRLGLICGFLGCDVRPFNPLLDALPHIMVVSNRAGNEDGWLGQFMRLAVTEATEKRQGGEGVLERLSELMFVEAVRRHLNALPDQQTGWLAGLRDGFVGRALTLMHGSPAHPWNIDELSREVGLSRSSLAERFTQLIGQPPMQYLTQWRMQIAARLLSSGTASIYAIAQDVGYGSEAAFSRAFKKAVGQSPAIWRREQKTVEKPGFR